jgi:integrase
MARKKKRLYRKDGRWYCDFRDFHDVGGRQEALMPAGERFATKDRRTARRLAKARLKELRRARNRPPTEPGVDLSLLGDFVDHHLEREALETKKPKSSLAQLAQQLAFAIEVMGSDTRLSDIRTPEIQSFLDVLAKRKAGTETLRKYFYALSKLFRRARAEQVVAREHDPVGGIVNKPPRERKERRWLSSAEAALLLEAARLYVTRREDRGLVYAYALVATLLLTGGRPSEVCGLSVFDVDFETSTIRFRHHAHRRLKNDESARTMRMWPQLKEILWAYLQGPHAPTGNLLFPSPQNPERPLGSPKKLLAELSLRIGLGDDVTPKVARHTYCSARLQTLDHGAPIADVTVAVEMGHGSAAMVREIYGHVSVGDRRIRKDVVDFLVEDHPLIRARVERLRAVSEERNRVGPNLKNRVAPTVEMGVIEAGLEQPDLGPRKIAALLASRGMKISASGVRWVWARHDMVLAEKRREAARSGRLEHELQALKQRAA